MMSPETPTRTVSSSTNTSEHSSQYPSQYPSQPPVMNSEIPERKEETPFIVKVAFVILASCVFVGYSTYICFTSQDIQLPNQDILDRFVDIYGVEKSDAKKFLFYVTSAFVAFVVFLFTLMSMLFFTEYMYSYCFGGFIFGHSFHGQGSGTHKIFQEVKEELVKMNQHMHENSIFEIVEVLKNIRRETSTAVATITNSPAHSQRVEFVNTQLSESVNSEINEKNTSNEESNMTDESIVSPRKTKATRRTNGLANKNKWGHEFGLGSESDN